MRGRLLVGLGCVALVLALLFGAVRGPGLFVAFVLFFLASSAFSTASQIADMLAGIVGRPMRVEVWGRPLPASSNDCTVVGVSALGVGLLLHLRPLGSDAAVLLKVAQPNGASGSDGNFRIADAKYVSWNGERIRRDLGRKVPSLVLFSTAEPNVMTPASVASSGLA